MPDFSHERKTSGIVIGIDEAGRGPWAGPVMAAAVLLDRERLSPLLRDGLADSKTLSRERRSVLFEALLREARFGIGAASVEEIDRHNILKATFRAMARAVRALGIRPDLALVDGNRAPPLPCPVETIIKGDSLSLSIAAASIIAKVTRDRLMDSLARRYPGFGWERNAGYGTAEHQAALDRFGVTPHHRRSFAPIAQHLVVSGPADSISANHVRV
ncbi:MAG: ribonuclease HII [Alphaproteobacteria bacterium]